MVLLALNSNKHTAYNQRLSLRSNTMAKYVVLNPIWSILDDPSAIEQSKQTGF
jgi:hypothetical protein